MAFIEKIEKEDKRFRKQEPAETTYSTGIIDGQKIFQLNMYGTNHRQDVGKASQVIQLDQESAKHLIQLLQSTFLL